MSDDFSSRRQGKAVWISASNSGMNLKPLLRDFLCLHPATVCVLHACVVSDYTTAWVKGRKIQWQLHFQSWVHINEGLKRASKRVKAHLGLQWQLSLLIITLFLSLFVSFCLTTLPVSSFIFVSLFRILLFSHSLFRLSVLSCWCSFCWQR